MFAEKPSVGDLDRQVTLRVPRSGSDAVGRPARREHHRRRKQRWSVPMPRPNDSRRSLIPLEQESTLIAVVELSRSSWLVAGIVPGLERHPLKKLEPDEDALLRLLRRRREGAARAGGLLTPLAVAFPAGP